MNVSRRSFLRSLLAAPFVVNAEWIMPVRVAPLPFLRGDLVDFKIGMYRATGLYAVCEPVLRVERAHVVTTACGGQNGEMRVPAQFVELFHGLPGNRVDNPSMAHRLIRRPGLGLAYPEDLQRVGARPTREVAG
jgi:hypothetical protein